MTRLIALVPVVIWMATGAAGQAAVTGPLTEPLAGAVAAPAAEGEAEPASEDERVPATAPATGDAARPAPDPDTDPVTDADGLFRPASEARLGEFLWTHRPVLVFADNENDPRYAKQMEYLATRSDELAERDVVVLFDADPATGSDARDRMHPRGFMLVLMSKDGQVYLRKPFPWDVREIMRSIDKMPLRQQEIRDRR